MKVRKNWSKLPSSTSFEHPHNTMTLSLPIYVDFCGHEYRNPDYFQELEDMDSK